MNDEEVLATARASLPHAGATGLHHNRPQPSRSGFIAAGGGVRFRQ